MCYVRASLLDKLYNDTEQGILAFPNGVKQDIADVLAQAIMRHFPNNITQHAPKGNLGGALKGNIR